MRTLCRDGRLSQRIRINVPSLADEDAAAAYLERGRTIQDAAIAREAVILELVVERL